MRAISIRDGYDSAVAALCNFAQALGQKHTYRVLTERRTEDGRSSGECSSVVGRRQALAHARKTLAAYGGIASISGPRGFRLAINADGSEFHSYGAVSSLTTRGAA